MRWLAAALALVGLGGVAFAEPVHILFVGDSFTHGRYAPVLNYNAGPGGVRDLLCPARPCPGSAEDVAPIVPSRQSPPPTLAFLQANRAARLTEPGPFGGVPGIVLQFTREAGLDVDIAILARSATSLQRHARLDLARIAQPGWDRLVLQEHSSTPLPFGDPAKFRAGLHAILAALDEADAAVGKAPIPVTLFETPPIAAYAYVSRDPAAPLIARHARTPYRDAPDPIARMAQDLHDSYAAAASQAGRPVGVAYAGDAWVTAVRLGLAMQDPYRPDPPPGQIDLWDSDPLDACCTVPIGFHPSAYGDYLNALVLFQALTSRDPRGLTAEFEPGHPSAAAALGIAPATARALAAAAATPR